MNFEICRKTMMLRNFFFFRFIEIFLDSANTFLQKTNEHVLQGLNPGGIYQAIWCRDAAYILKDWFLSGKC